LHNRLYGPFEGNTRSHRRQSRCVNSISLEGASGVVRALRAIVLSSLHDGSYHAVATIPAHLNEQMPYRPRWRCQVNASWSDHQASRWENDTRSSLTRGEYGMREGSWASGGGCVHTTPSPARRPPGATWAGSQAQHPPLREATRELAYSVWMGVCFLGLLWSRAIRKQHSWTDDFVAPLGLIAVAISSVPRSPRTA
jgi:hypothetical protein